MDKETLIFIAVWAFIAYLLFKNKELNTSRNYYLDRYIKEMNRRKTLEVMFYGRELSEEEVAEELDEEDIEEYS